MKPCIGNAALYDLVLFDDGPAEERQQAIHRAAALCASCPAPCADKVTADSQPRELVLLEPDWMPPAREGRSEPAKFGGRRKQDAGPKVGEDYVPPSRRIAAWAATAAELAADDRSLADIADHLCVTQDTARQLIAIGRGERLEAA